MNVHKKYVLWILFLSIQGLGSYYAETDDGYYYSVEYEPLNYKPESKGSYDGGGTDKDHDYHYAMDLALVFDSSYTITSDGWSKIKEAAKKLTNNLDVSPDGTHVSMLVYSTNVDDYYMFDDNANTRKISKLIDGLTYYGEWSRLDRALSALPHHVFSPFNGARSDVPKVVVVFTDGKLEGPSTSRRNEADLYKSLARSVDNLHREDVVVYGVASGASDSKVFDLIAGDRSRIFSIDNIDELINSLLNISIRIYNAHFHQKEKESNKYASSSAAVGSTATLTTTINMTVTVTAGESLLPMSPAQPISSTQTGQASKSALTSPVNQVSSSVGFTITSFTLTATASNSLPLNKHTPTSTVPLSLTAITNVSGTVTATPRGVSSSSTCESSRPLSTNPSIQGSLGAKSTIAGASLSATQSNQPITSTKTATSGKLLLPMTSTAGAEPSPSKTETVSPNQATSAIGAPLATTPFIVTKPKESTSPGESSSSSDIHSIQLTSASTTPSTSTSLAPTPSSMATSMESATVGQTLLTSSSEVPSSIGNQTASAESTATTATRPVPSTESLASPKTASASESMSVVPSSQQASPIATISVSGSLSATRSSTGTTSTPGSSASSVIPNIQPGIASFGTVTTTVTVTVTPTSQIIASPSITSASGLKASSRDQIQDGSRRYATERS